MKLCPISYHHLGGRGGKFPINIPAQLRDSVNMVVYDGDESCIEDAKRQLENQGFHEINVYPYCISDQEGIETFYISKQPHNSSLLKPNEEVFPYIRMSPKYGAMRLREICKIHAEIKIKTSLFQTVLSQKKMQQPDFISLDIQGKEYEVIHSARKVFEEALLVNFEFSFAAQYENQKNFPEMHNLMLDLGFILVDFKLYDPHHLVRTPIDFQGKAFLFDGEAFYLKKPGLFENAPVEKILKYCFAAIICEQAHLCVQIFDCERGKLLSLFNQNDAIPSFVTLVKELFYAYEKSEKIFLPFFHESSVYKNYHSNSLMSDPAIKPDVLQVGKTPNPYASVLRKYGLKDFASHIEDQKNINLETLEHLKKG